jgi:hypothetical protein
MVCLTGTKDSFNNEVCTLIKSDYATCYECDILIFYLLLNISYDCLIHMWFRDIARVHCIMYVCIRDGPQKTSPCTATFEDLLCLLISLTPY